ncbi:hypothetical protein FJT64_003061 [Amphibalanus amphitrite]|uniref:Uncharacterized protein n=1 Tax=Amphibalanus amphitrite TaxID=1232801 RepID=A0A6A4W9K9_AMPAM|nr:hypothetical protein FJT64_003061 [Amphibalanus amphitrite]
MTPLEAGWFDPANSAPVLSGIDGAPPAAGSEHGPAPLRLLCEAAVERHLAVFTAPLSVLTETELVRHRPPGPFDHLPPEVADRLTARLLRRRPTHAELAQLYCLTSRRLTSARLSGKAAGCRARAVALRLRAPRLKQLVCDIICDCDATDICDGHSAVVRLAVSSRYLRVFEDSSRHCLSGRALHRLLSQCPLLERLSLRLPTPDTVRELLTGRSFPAMQQLELRSERAGGCWDISALAQLFPGLQVLTLTGQPAPAGVGPAEERCSCRYRVGPRLPQLETARLEHLCGAAAAGVRAAAPRLHTLRLLECVRPASEAGTGARRPASLGGLVRAVLRRRLATLPSDQVRRLQLCQHTVDAAFVNRLFPQLQTLAVQCSVLDGPAPACGGSPLWFPCLERLSVHLSGGGDSWEEPAFLRRPVPCLTEYRQSFGCVSVRRLAAACPLLESLRLAWA